METFADKIIRFNKNLALKLPNNHIQVLDPFSKRETRRYSEIFYKKYYNDNIDRVYLIGINPGRFGAGQTGVCFVDPVKLEINCGIENPFPKRAELSSDFIFMIVEAMGGTELFFKRFLLTALCPLGFVKDGKNINYYDDKQLLHSVKPFIINKMLDQIKFGTSKKLCFCIGEGTNFKFFSSLNKEHHFFEEIIPLPHPRFILQYKRKKLEEYIIKYKEELENAYRQLFSVSW
jgi:hypothetical protein